MVEKRITSFESSGLGLKRDGSVSLCAHNPRWTREFSQEAHRIFETLQIPELRLYHIGSTAIPGIHAKPVIDILITTPSHQLLDSKKSAFEDIGYEYKGEYGLAGRRYCVLYGFGKDKGYVHLHAYEDTYPEIERHLVFRDFLRRNSDQAKRYENLKLDLIEKQKVNRSAYLEMKAPLIEELTTNAFAWKKSYKPRQLILLGSAEGGHRTEEWVLSQAQYQNCEIVRLHDQDISPYSYKGVYSSTDSFLNVVDKVLQADSVVFASPVYWYSLSGHIKLFLDRLTDLISTHQDLGKKLYGKSMELIATGSNDKAPIGFDIPINLTALYFGMDYLGMKYRCVKDEG